MMFSDHDIKLIVACLQSTAINYDNQAREALAKFKHQEAAQYGAFGGACAALAARIEKELKGLQRLVIPRGH